MKQVLEAPGPASIAVEIRAKNCSEALQECEVVF